jgi:hypothetical protein
LFIIDIYEPSDCKLHKKNFFYNVLQNKHDPQCASPVMQQIMAIKTHLCIPGVIVSIAAIILLLMFQHCPLVQSSLNKVAK